MTDAKGPSTPAQPSQQRPSARTRRRRLARLGTAACLAVLLVGLVWVVVTGLLARSALTAARSDLPRLRAAVQRGDVAGARTLAEDIARRAGRAHSLTSGPAWWVAANLPAVGTPLRTTQLLAEATDEVAAGALPAIERVASTVENPQTRRGTSVDLSVIAALSPDLQRAAASVAAAQHLVARSSAHSWSSTTNNARGRLATDLNTLSAELSGARLALRTALPMLGADGPRRYFVAFENDAEARGLGGLPGAFAIVTADHGRISFTHYGSDVEFSGVRTDLELGREFDARYSQDDPANYYPNSDISPHFPYAARIWAAMWQRVSGQRVDGALAVDPTALKYLLAVTGPARLPGGGQVGASNVVALTQSTEYRRYPAKDEKAERKKFVVAVAHAIGDKIGSATGDGAGLLHAISRAVSERRLVVWSSDAGDERNLVTAGWAGVLPQGPAPVGGFTVTNAAGSKLDYYLDRTMTYHRDSCAPNATVDATLRLTNTAPRRGLPRYVTLRIDDPPRDARPGDNRDIVTYYATRGAQVRGVTLDGRPVPYAVGTETGLVAVAVDVEMPAGRSRTVRVRTTEAHAATGAVRLLRQPLARPLITRISGPAC